jgi:hypothetical protein
MTHTSHRRGDRDSLLGDWILLTRMPQGYPPEVQEKMKKLIKICASNNPIALRIYNKSGDRLRYTKGWEKRMDSGIHYVSSIEEVQTDPGRLHHAVYKRKEDVLEVIKGLVEADVGLSVVVSGVFEEVHDICRKAGTGPHTVNMSAETLGRTELLPEPRVLELLTMCGHSYISSKLIRHMIERVSQGKVSAEDAAVELGKQCTCNIFNVFRGAELLKKAAFG